LRGHETLFACQETGRVEIGYCSVVLMLLERRNAMTLALTVLLAPLGAGRAVAQQTGNPLRAELAAVAALAGEPRLVSAGGVTRDETPLLTLENGLPFALDDTRRRLVLVGGLEGDSVSARLVLDAVRWFKETAPPAARGGWALSALPLARPGGTAPLPPHRFPPAEDFFDDAQRPETHYVWRWTTYQAPDLVVVVTGVSGDNAGSGLSLRSGSDADDARPGGALARALASGVSEPGLGPVETLHVTASESDSAALVGVLRDRLAPVAARSPLHQAIATRVDRDPLDIARLLAARYPGTVGMSYIPGVAWTHTLALAELTGDDRWRDQVLDQVRPWLSGEQALVGDPVRFASVAGAMVFAELAKRPGEDREAASVLADLGAAVSATETAPGVPEHGSGWTDDMFLGTIVASRRAHPGGLLAAARLIANYADRLQQPNGLFHHAADAPVAWGRGNGFAALGLAEILTALPAADPARSALLEIYRRQMLAMREHQAPDGMWTQVVDVPGSYREASVTALTLTAMARGIRHGWLDESYRLVVARAWRALLAHVRLDGTLVDVCISTGAGPTRRYYLDRTAVNGADDRGGALILGAALEVHALER
jgi:unsaturated rhamnogalacturonyl hydrolase